MSNVTEYNQIEIPFQDSSNQEEIIKLNRLMGKLEHDLFFLYVFLTSNEISEEACDFLEAHEDDPIPFRMYS